VYELLIDLINYRS